MTGGPAPGLVFHHVGVACADLHAESARLAVLGYEEEAPPFVDERQGVRGVFLVGQAPRLELLEPLDAQVEGPLTPWLRKDFKLYHLGYETPDLHRSIDALRAGGAKLVVPPLPAVAFDGRLIAFVMLANRLLCELIDAGYR